MTAVAALMLIVVAVCSAGFTKHDGTWTMDDVYESNGTLDGHKYVDLGLPSRTLWATCNVGASKPEECGDYFAWGEIQVKRKYDWDTYIHGDRWELDKHTDYSLNKYCSKSIYGDCLYTDNLTKLQSCDDVATVRWGSGWHIPTKEQCEELLQKTTQKYEILNGRYGLRCIGRNGKSIFLPASGMMVGDKVKFRDGEMVFGYCWSSSLYTDKPCNAYRISFDPKPNSFGNYSYQDRLFEENRECGLPVRPVRSAK